MSCNRSPWKPGQGWAHGEVITLSEHTWTEIKQSVRGWHADKSPFWFGVDADGRRVQRERRSSACRDSLGVAARTGSG